MTAINEFLQETQYFDYSHAALKSWAVKITKTTPKQQVVELYYMLRDGIRYNPYTFTNSDETFKASYAAQQDETYCIPKSAIMVAVCRSIGIPARIGFADVRNHLSSPQLLAMLKTDLFVMHGYVEVYIEGQWVKCTPVFNSALCEKLAVKPLEFDGENDSIFHPYTEDGRPHMQYVFDHGTYADMPVQKIIDHVAHTYPHIDMNIGFQSPTSLEKDLVNLSDTERGL